MGGALSLCGLGFVTWMGDSLGWVGLLCEALVSSQQPGVLRVARDETEHDCCLP